MPRSTERPTRLSRLARRAVVCAIVLAATARADAQDGALRIRDTALNRFAAAALPLTITRNFTFEAWVPNPLLLPPLIPIPITCSATASVVALTFQTTPASTLATGAINGNTCGISYSATLFTNVAVSVDPAGSSLSIIPGSTSFRPTVNLGFINVPAPFTLSFASPLAVTIPLGGAPVEVDTPGGVARYVLRGRNLRVVRQFGVIEIQGDAAFE